MRHLRYDEIERYLSEEELTDAYLSWLEPVLSHLEICDACRKLVDRKLFYEEVCENKVEIAPLLSKESIIRREYVAEDLSIMGKEKLAKHLRSGNAKTYQVELRNGQLWTIWFCDNNNEKITLWEEGYCMQSDAVEILFEEGKLFIEVACEPNQDVSAVFMGMDRVEKPVYTEGVWYPGKQKAVIESPVLIREYTALQKIMKKLESQSEDYERLEYYKDGKVGERKTPPMIDPTSSKSNSIPDANLRVSPLLNEDIVEKHEIYIIVE